MTNCSRAFTFHAAPLYHGGGFLPDLPKGGRRGRTHRASVLSERCVDAVGDLGWWFFYQRLSYFIFVIARRMASHGCC